MHITKDTKCFVLNQQVVAKRYNNKKYQMAILIYIAVRLIVITIGPVIEII